MFRIKEAINKRRRRHHLGGWSGLYYLSACRRAHSTMSDQMMVYEKPASIKEHQNEIAERLQ
jgi:hypothetical protein